MPDPVMYYIVFAIRAVFHERYHPVPIDALASHVWLHTKVVPIAARPVEVVGIQIRVAEERSTDSFKAMSFAFYN